ncbi:MAG: hypothetical protein ABW128_21825 [Rhizorhabdus sp.]
MTLAELDARMSRDEFQEWMAYYSLEPWGTPVEDGRWSQMFTLFYSANSKPGATIPVWFDRDPEETARKEAARPLEDKITDFYSRLSTRGEGDEIDDVDDEPSS